MESIKQIAEEEIFSQLHYGHFIEIGYLDQVYQEKIVKKHNLVPENIFFIIHGGSMKAGLYAYESYLEKFMVEAAVNEYIPYERIMGGLGGVPLNSPSGQEYLNIVLAITNYAYARRQISQALVAEAMRRATSLNDSFVVRAVSDTPHTKLDLVDSKIIQRNGVQRIDSTNTVKAICSSRALPSFLLAWQGLENNSFICHGRGRSEFLRNSISGED